MMRLPQKTLTSAGLRWTLHRLAERLGWLGWLALGLSIVLLLNLLWMAHSASLRLAQAEAEVAALTAGPLASAHAQPADPNRYVQLFPEVSQRNQIISDIMALAASMHLRLDNVRYRHVQVQALGLQQTVMEFTLFASYPSVRPFLGALLQRWPALSLDAMTMNRASRFDAELELHLRLNLYFRHPS